MFDFIQDAINTVMDVTTEVAATVIATPIIATINTADKVINKLREEATK